MDNSQDTPIIPKKIKKPTRNAQVEELTNDLKRIQAEFVNYKRRAEEDKQRAILIGREQAVAVLLPILDSLDRAIAHEPDDIKDHQWVKGIAAVVKQLETQMAEIGLTKIGVVGELFDPELHEAVSMIDGDGEQDIIIGVAQVGYMLDSRVIRHAVVQVGKQ